MRDFNFKKKFGQNFLTDSNLLEKIVSVAGVSSDDVVIEIGAGKGALTSVLSKYAKKVIAFEIDSELQDFLTDKFSGTNVELVFEDIMNYDKDKIKSLAGEKFKLVANLPYYITSPILTKFLNIDLLISATVMVQEEVADRIIADPKTKDYGVLSIICQSQGECKKALRVNRTMFTPQPKVDSAVVCITKTEDNKFCNGKFFDFVKTAFSMRRKKLSANLEALNIKKSDVETYLQGIQKSPLSRAEELTISELYGIFEHFCLKKLN